MLTPAPAFRQASFEDLGTPLADVTFCVIDLETTGGSAETEGITEVAAVKVRGGEVVGSFQTLIDPGRAIPTSITVLTGITDCMVMRAPRIGSVLPTLLEFIGDSVIVGHNVRFDLGFLNAALSRADRPRLGHRSLDTCALARRLVRDEVPNCKLDTLARRLRLDHKPTHRALDDVLATVDLLHFLIERASAFGVSGLDDLLALPTMSGHAQAGKLKLTERLPRSPGVYLFKDRVGQVVYVGKATDLRARVRSYFSSDSRRKVGALLREAAAVDHVVCASALEAGVLEVRLIHEHQPRYNQQGRNRDRQCYVKLTAERFPRLSIVVVPKTDGATYLGPVSSKKVAQLIVDAIHTAVPLRRCTERPGRSRRDGPCTAAQLGVSTCPCAGTIDETAYAVLAERVRLGLSARPALLLAPLAERMNALAASERFEEAADLRNRADALASAIVTSRRHTALRRTQLDLELPGGVHVSLDSGRLTPPRRAATGVESLPWPVALGAEPESGDHELPPSPAEAAELGVVSRFLERYADRIRIVHCIGELSHPLDDLPTFKARESAGPAGLVPAPAGSSPVPIRTRSGRRAA